MKKGQITAFIIVGVVVILAAAFFLFYRNATVDIIPEDVQPVATYVESCLQAAGKDAIIELGAQGGFTTIPEELRATNSVIELIPGSVSAIPYWFVNGKTVAPSIEFMEQEVNKAIQNNVQRCLDFDILSNDYDITPTKEPTVETTIAEQDVTITLTYPLQVNSRGDQTSLEHFQTTLDVKLKKIHELGMQILEAENAEMIFENMTIDWMSINDDVPLNGLEFGCREKKWEIEEIKESLQQTIYYNIPLVRVQNTVYPDFEASSRTYNKYAKYDIEDINKGNYPDNNLPRDAYEYQHYFLDVRTRQTPLTAGFLYQPQWGMEIVANPSDNGILRSVPQGDNNDLMSFLCLNSYHFTYDIRYPIEVLLRDNEAFNGKGYVFRYAFPVMINHNMPDREGFLNPDLYFIGTNNVGHCKEPAGPTYDIRARGIDEFGIANTEINNVNISYDCYTFECGMGQTGPDSGLYRLRAALPETCSGGFIVAEKEGYLDARQQVLDSTDIVLDLQKLHTFTFEVVANEYNSLNDHMGPNIAIQEPFMAVINLQNTEVPSHRISRVYPFEDTDKRVIQLLEQGGTYEVDIQLFDEADNVLIGGYQGNWTTEFTQRNHIVFHAASYLPKPLNSVQEIDAIRFLEENANYKQQLLPETR